MTGLLKNGNRNCRLERNNVKTGEQNDNNNDEWNLTMIEKKSVTKDPICGMTVDEATALHAERSGKTFYFCCNRCRQKFLLDPVGAKPDDKSGCCCG
jgi:YHS domain-containing protein